MGSTIAAEISLAEVHDCFSPTELVLMEDRGFSGAWSVLARRSRRRVDLDGELPVNPDGGLRSFGHPTGASGLRRVFECWSQFRGEAAERQYADPKLGLTHNLGGQPAACVSIVGAEPGA